MMTSRLRPSRLLLVATVWVTVAAVPLPAQAPAGRSFLWTVQGPASTLYLAGSVHALSPDAYPLGAAWERAFAESATLIEEIDLGEAGMLALAPALLGKGMYQDGRRFDMAVSPETAAKVTARLQAAGVPAAMFQTMKPWMVMLTLTAIEAQAAGLDMSLGLDQHFYERAVAAGKPVEGLETASSQIDRLDRMPESTQEQMLLSTLNELDTAEESLGAIVDGWRRGDAAFMEEMLLGAFEGYPEAYASLIVERNRNWMPRIEACLRGAEPCFVVVGAAHLVGPDGLLAELRARGYRVEQQ